MSSRFLAGAFLLSALPLLSQEERSWIDFRGGTLLQKASWKEGTSSSFQNGPVLGFGGGTWFTSRWGSDFELLAARIEARESSATGSEFHLSGSLLFNLYPAYRWAPYLRAGLGATYQGAELHRGYPRGSLDAAPETAAHLVAGAGFHVYPGERFKLGLETRLCRIQASAPARRTEGQLLLSIGYRWGGIKPASEPIPAILRNPPPQATPVPAARVTPETLPVVPPSIATTGQTPVLAPASAQTLPEAPRVFVLGQEALGFASGKADLGPGGIAAIQALAEKLKALRGDSLLVVTGYAGSQEGPGLSKPLSRRRAEAVAAILGKAGIPSSSILPIGRGAEHPISRGLTPEEQALNRRVEIEIRTRAGALP